MLNIKLKFVILLHAVDLVKFISVGANLVKVSVLSKYLTIKNHSKFDFYMMWIWSNFSMHADSNFKGCT